jgi:hypothetical protein
MRTGLDRTGELKGHGPRCDFWSDQVISLPSIGMAWFVFSMGVWRGLIPNVSRSRIAGAGSQPSVYEAAVLRWTGVMEW